MDKQVDLRYTLPLMGQMGITWTWLKRVGQKSPNLFKHIQNIIFLEKLKYNKTKAMFVNSLPNPLSTYFATLTFFIDILQFF